MIRPLIRIRLTRLSHRLRSMDLLTALRLVVVGVVGAVILVDGLQSLWIDRALAVADAAARRAEILSAAMRLATVLAGVVAFTTFGDLWRNPESEILGRLPIPPRALYQYRLLTSTAANLPALLIAVAALVPVAVAGEGVIFLHALITVTVTFALALLWGLYWHLVAGAGVADPETSALKQMSAGNVTAPERAMLLYSPMFAVATAFGVGFMVFLGLDGLVKGTALGPAGLAAGAVGLWLGARRGAEAFEASYYRAAAALADGEALDSAFTTASPEPEFFGQLWVFALPAPLRPFARRDLRQAWRRNRLVPWAFVGVSAGLAALGPRLEGWLPAAIGAAGILAGAEAFRMSRLGSDAPWFWLTLPAGTGRQVLGRLGAALMFPAILSVGVAIALWRGGSAPAEVGLWVASLAALAVVAANLSTLSVGGGRAAAAVYLLICAGALVASGGDGQRAAVYCGALAALSFGALARLRARLASLEAAR